MKTTTVAELQDIQRTADESEQSGGSYLADLAQRMVDERQVAAVEDAGDPFEGMSIDVDPADAFGLVQAAVKGWLEDNGRWASEIEVRHESERLMQLAQQQRPGPVRTEATYNVGSDGLVDGYTVTERPAAPKSEPAAQELPSMPLAPLRVPSDSVFGDDGEYAVSTALARRAAVLVQRHPEHFDHLHGLTVTYLWKRQGGKSKGRVVFGKCTKLGGLVRHFAEVTYVIWLAADHCRAANFDDRQIEALLFHEMMHTGVSEVDENTGRGGGAITKPHELEVFRAEIEIYGLWAPDLRAVAPAFQQASLFDEDRPSNAGEVLAALDEALSAGDGILDCRGCGQHRDLDAQGRCELCAADAATGDRNDPENYSDPMGNPPPDPVGDGAGVLIWPDGTEMTPEEIAEMEAREAQDL